jgi:hypothetical protein
VNPLFGNLSRQWRTKKKIADGRTDKRALMMAENDLPQTQQEANRTA